MKSRVTALSCVMAVACGARSELDVPDGAASKLDASADHGHDALVDASHVDVVEDDAPPVGCTIAIANVANPCSTSESGVAQRQFNPPGFQGPGWSGPYIWLAWATHVIGTCP